MWLSAQIHTYDAEDIFDLPSSRSRMNESLVKILTRSAFQEAEEHQPD